MAFISFKLNRVFSALMLGLSVASFAQDSYIEEDLKKTENFNSQTKVIALLECTVPAGAIFPDQPTVHQIVQESDALQKIIRSVSGTKAAFHPEETGDKVILPLETTRVIKLTALDEYLTGSKQKFVTMAKIADKTKLKSALVVSAKSLLYENYQIDTHIFLADDGQILGVTVNYQLVINNVIKSRIAGCAF